MSRRSKRSSFPLPRGAAKWVLGFNLVVALVLGGWYLAGVVIVQWRVQS